MNKNSRIFLAGHKTMIGASFQGFFNKNGYTNIITASPCELDLTDQLNVKQFFFDKRPEYVILAAGKSGGILANMTCPVDFVYNNLQIQCNVIHFSWKSGVKKLLFLGSSCMYPHICPQPVREDCLLTGPLEPTSEPSAISRIAGVKMCQAYNRQYGTSFIPVVPAGIYGPHDDFNLESSHVLAALLRKTLEAKEKSEKEVVIWGTGSPRREFLYVDDLVEACVLLMNRSRPLELINIGYGEDITIKELAQLIKKIVGYKGDIRFDGTKPDGTAKKLLDSSNILKMGWKPKVSLKEGIEITYKWYQQHKTG